jgi:hypothetical protein
VNSIPLPPLSPPFLKGAGGISRQRGKVTFGMVVKPTKRAQRTNIGTNIEGSPQKRICGIKFHRIRNYRVSIA